MTPKDLPAGHGDARRMVTEEGVPALVYLVRVPCCGLHISSKGVLLDAKKAAKKTTKRKANQRQREEVCISFRMRLT